MTAQRHPGSGVTYAMSAAATLCRMEQWRVPVKVPVAKLLVGAVVVVAVLLTGVEWVQLAVAGAVALGLAGWAARDLVAPVRLAASVDTIAVRTGFARWHRLTWSQVERVRVDVRRRSRMLEVDTGETLFLFSRYDLDADLDEVAARLEQLRASSG